MVTRSNGKITLTVVALLLCMVQGGFSQRTPATSSRPTRKTFDLQVEVTTGNPAEKVEGAKVLVASEEEGPKFNKDKKTSKQGVASFSKVPQGKIKVQVVARECDTFGDVYTVSQDDQTIKITVKKRNPPAGSTPGVR